MIIYHVLYVKFYCIASMNTIRNNLDKTVRHGGVHHNYKEYNIMSNYLAKRNSCKIQIMAWTISYYHRYKERWIY